ncbi:MAG: S9 family peptidase [Planctomycetia bacterium]|nr:S9 family peptidase [Planctomycetia bacterium]
MLVHRWLLVTLLSVTSVTATFAEEKRPLAIEDLYRYDAATDPALAPDRQRVAYTRDWAEPGMKIRRQAIWTAAGSSEHKRPLEVGEPDGRKPVWSPDGRWLAFLSTRPFPDGSPAFSPVPPYSDVATDIWLMPANGDKAIPLAGKGKPYGRVFSDGFYGRVAFSPDSKRLVFVADDGRDTRTPEEHAAGITVVREDQGEGYTGYGTARIWVAELAETPTAVAATNVKCLTTDDAWYGDPQWSPDGTFLVAHANRSTDRESVRFSINKNYDIWRIEVASGSVTPLTTGPGPEVSPRLSSDGRRLLCLSVPRKGPHADVYNLLVVDLAPSGVSSRVLFDHHGPEAEKPPHSSPTFPLPAEPWLDDERIIYDTVAGVKSLRQMVALKDGARIDSENETEPTQLADLRQARERLIPPSHAYLQDRELGESKIIAWKSTDGTAIDGILTLPPASVVKPPYKLLVYPHGGPHGRAAEGFNFTAELFAAHGYAVFQPNFRGSTGYGRKFLDADRFDFGGGDMQDILTGIDELVRRKIVDPQRQFVYGISYGGFMTNWLVGHTTQFRAAATQNSVTDLNMMWGLSDLPSWTEWEMGGLPWDVSAKMRAHSPLTYAAQVRTPTLVLHADHDRRCPLAMGRMWYQALKKAGVETEMVIYHDERHGLYQLPHQADVYRRALAWFAKYDAAEKPLTPRPAKSASAR